jgi:hypothetical protein
MTLLHGLTVVGDTRQDAEIIQHWLIWKEENTDFWSQLVYKLGSAFFFSLKYLLVLSQLVLASGLKHKCTGRCATFN